MFVWAPRLTKERHHVIFITDESIHPRLGVVNLV